MRRFIRSLIIGTLFLGAFPATPALAHSTPRSSGGGASSFGLPAQLVASATPGPGDTPTDSPAPTETVAPSDTVAPAATATGTPLPSETPVPTEAPVEMTLPSSASQSAPSPSITVSLWDDSLRADGFAPGALLTFNVYASEGESDPILQVGLIVDESGSVFYPGEDHSVELIAGNYVVASDGVNARTLVLEPLYIHLLDPVAEVVVGTASPGELVSVIVSDLGGDPGSMEVYAGEGGLWTADFASTFDIGWDMRATAEVFDEDGDRTVFNTGATQRPPPFPHLKAYPDRDFVQGGSWPIGQLVSLEVGGLTFDATADSDEIVEFTLAGYDLRQGDTLTMSSADTTVVHVVKQLFVTDLSVESQTVAGTVDGPNGVRVFSGWDELYGYPDGSGNWLVDFSFAPDPVLSPGVCGSVEAWDESESSTIVDWCVPSAPPNPYLRAFPDGDRVDGYNWPADQTVFLEVEGNVFGATVSGDGYVEFALPGVDLRQGDTLTMTSGDLAVVHTVKQLFVTAIDIQAQTVAGTVDGPEVVHVFSGPGDLYVNSDGDGNWLADFSGFGEPVLFPGACGNAEAWGEGASSTIIDWCLPPPPPNPRFTVFPEWDFFDGLDWQDGAVVTITVADKPECQVVKESWGGFFNGNFGQGCDVRAADRVTFTDGTTTRTHMVRNLTVGTVDEDADTVAGTADPGATVYVWPHDTGQQGQVTADADGAWQVDFSGAYDIVPGSAGRSEIRDPAGNTTAVDWNVPNPHFVIFPEGEWIDAYDWPDGEPVTATVQGKPDCEAEGSSLGGFLNMGFPEGCDVTPGDLVTLTDGATERTHTVRNLSITAVNEAEDIVSGIADANAVVNVWPHETGQPVQVTADAGGAWQVDFTGSFDVVPGSQGRSQTDDEIGNGTAVDWSAPLNYDIYVFDTRTGQTRQITSLGDTGEYNPAWSRSGKKIAHDVWGSSDGYQAIHLTDVATGVSTPLAGAEGGHDAVWSPSDKWIAFDRGPAGDQSLYVVPSKGGARRLVREDAVAAGWSPSGLRLVFQQPSDGSIRTVGWNGGYETLVAPGGYDPVWSPDGRWIAYESQGAIWKVRVTPRGQPIGMPIRVTTGRPGEHQPTWSADSRTIAFHSGLGGDEDIWTIPATGGTATWLTGAPGFGDYDPSYSSNGRYVAYASFSPSGQAPRLWIGAYTYDPPVGTLTEGDHPYHFDFDWSLPEPGTWSDQEGVITVSPEAESYEGYVLLRGPEELRRSPDGAACEQVDAVSPDQLTRFLIGWLTDSEMTYPQAQAHFGSISARVIWDETGSAELLRHEILPWPSTMDDWFQYVCTYAQLPGS